MEKPLCTKCKERPVTGQSYYCTRCHYQNRKANEARNQKRKEARMVAEATINNLDSEITELIEDLGKTESGIEKLYLQNRLSRQTKNLVYTALNLVKE